MMVLRVSLFITWDEKRHKSIMRKKLQIMYLNTLCIIERSMKKPMVNEHFSLGF